MVTRKGKRIDLYVSNEIYEKIMDICISEGRTKSNVVRVAIIDYINQKSNHVRNCYGSSKIYQTAQKGDL